MSSPSISGDRKRRKAISREKITPQAYYLRRMVKKDIPSVLEIEHRCFPNPWRETTFEGEIGNYGISYPNVVVLKGEERVIGYMIYWMVRDEVQIANLAVHPDFRRQGIAEGVMREVLAKVKKEGAKLVILEVRPSNVGAGLLYQKLGFRPLGIRKGYYRTPDEDAIVMGRLLDN